jgi:hypothetical protein
VSCRRNIVRAGEREAEVSATVDVAVQLANGTIDSYVTVTLLGDCYG